MSSLAKHVIHQPKPSRTILLIIFVVIISNAVQWLFQQQQQVRQQQDNQQLRDEISRLKTHNGHYTVTTSQHYSQLLLEQATTEKLRQKLSESQQQVLTLDREILFYQAITKGSSSSKLQIRELHLRADDVQPDLIRYRLIISQGKKINKAMAGTIRLIVNSDNNGSIEQQTIEAQPLNLRHVQVIEGQIKLKAASQPISVTVELIRKKKTTLSQTFDWLLSSNNYIEVPHVQ